MNDSSSTLVFATPDLPFRDDIRRLGAIVGEVLSEQVSQAFLDEVKAIRNVAIAHREQGAPIGELEARLRDRSVHEAERLVRAFGSYFQVVNIAERIHRIRRRRDYQRSGTTVPQPDGVHDALMYLKAQGVTLTEIEQWLPCLDVEPVFTAHPTEAVRRALLEKEHLLVQVLLGQVDGTRTPNEIAVDNARLRMGLTASWQTLDSSPVRPRVEDEREHLSLYLTRILYRVAPALYETLDDAIYHVFGKHVPLPRLLRFGSWVGGDMDGNPHVDASTIIATLDAQRGAVLARYLEELLRLARLLSQSTAIVAVSPALMQRLHVYQQRFPEHAALSRPRHADMPYRLLNDLMRARLQATIEDASASYESPEEFESDVQLMLESLAANKGRHAGWFAVRRLLWRVKTFGFHLARLDVRQDSRIHAQAIAGVLVDRGAGKSSASPQVSQLAAFAGGQTHLPAAQESNGQRLDAVFAALADARQRHGAAALGNYIISMTRDRADVLNVLALARRGGLVDANGAVPLDLVPLFETVDDLKRAAPTMEDLIAEPVYRAHLANRQNRQIVMLGYSDSCKDGGIAASRWALQRAQVELLERLAPTGIRLTFFHGRGGSVARGGGKTTQAVDAGPRGSVDGRLRVTEQGEVIHRNYGIRDLALRSLEQMTGAVLRSSLRPRQPEPRESKWRPVMELIAQHSSEAYLQFVHDEQFMQYFRQATPIDVIERMTLGSRPSRRLGEDAALCNLRAIPWVFAWTQARAGIPGWYGVGSGLQAAAEAGHEAVLHEMARDWPFFRMFLDDVAMILSKCDVSIAERFSQLSGPLHSVFFPRIRHEIDRTIQWVETLMEQETLLKHDPRLALSIRLRNPFIDPISILQMDLLQRWRKHHSQDDSLLRALVACVNSVAQGLQNTG